MTRHALAVVAALIVLLAVLALWPPSTKSDQPVVSVVPASEFVAIASPTRAVALSPATSVAVLPVPGIAQLEERRPKSEATGAEPVPGAGSETIAPTVISKPAGAPDGSVIVGTASWFASPIGVSAAGPALRTALGPGWRGTRVTVCAAGRCAVTVLSDWCQCPRRAIDLDAPVFAALAPLSQGLMEVTIEW